MLKLTIVAFVCARALALPAAPDTALTPPDLERTTGPKCCECNRGWHVAAPAGTHCKQQAAVKPNSRRPNKKESCKTTCAGYRGYADNKMYRRCDRPTNADELNTLEAQSQHDFEMADLAYCMSATGLDK